MGTYWSGPSTYPPPRDGEVDSEPSAKCKKWFPAFRDFPTGCLLLDGSVKVSWREVRETRKKHKDSVLTEGRLSLESYNAQQSAQKATIAFNATTAEYEQNQGGRQAQRRLQEISKQLRVEELTKRANELSAGLREAQMKRESLAKLLASQEAWIARNEVVGFVRDPKRRYSKEPPNFAKAMAGLPFYDWLYSLRKCISMPSVAAVPPTPLFQVFKLLEEIMKRTVPANLSTIELKLKQKLLNHPDPLLRSHIDLQWHYMTLAFSDFRGKRFNPTKLPYGIMKRFLDHLEGPSVAEFEMAQHNRLLS